MRHVTPGRLALVVCAYLWAQPAPAAACKPPQFYAEYLDFALIGARRGDQPVTFAGLPPQLHIHSDPYIGLWSEELGGLKRVETTAELPRATERYLRRQRRRFGIACAVVVYREPAVPGTYVPHRDPQADEPSWPALWPPGTPGVLEYGSARDHLRIRIEGPGAPLELEYRLIRASFHSCDMTAPGSPAPLLLVVVAGLLRRRQRRP